MEAKDKKEKLSKSEIEAIDSLPGAAIDNADDEKVTKDEVAERTRTLNNNPRNEGCPC